MEDSFSVKVKIETATKAVKKPVQRRTALCGLLLSSCADIAKPSDELKIPERLSELILQLLEMEGIKSSYSKGKIKINNIASSDLWNNCQVLFQNAMNGKLTNEDARRILRGAFWSTGYCSDPLKNYRIEFLLPGPEAASLIASALNVLSINHIKKERGGNTAVYFKNGDDVSDFLGYIGSPTGMMEFENIRAGKDINSKVIRAVNCDKGNTKRLAEAAAARNELITKVMESGMAGKLSPELREAAKAHMENPGASLAELGKMMDPPIGKSGMRHRLDKIAEFAKNLG